MIFFSTLLRWLLILTCLILIVTGCLSKAKLTDLPPDKNAIDFSKLENYRIPEGKRPKSKVKFEYFIEIESNTKISVEKLIFQALESEGFEIVVESTSDNYIKAQRSLRNNEWGSVAGVYYEVKPNLTQIYIICKITQDITGGWYEHRAKKIGGKICELHGAYVKSFVLESN